MGSISNKACYRQASSLGANNHELHMYFVKAGCWPAGWVIAHKLQAELTPDFADQLVAYASDDSFLSVVVGARGGLWYAPYTATELSTACWCTPLSYYYEDEATLQTQLKDAVLHISQTQSTRQHWH